MNLLYDIGGAITVVYPDGCNPDPLGYGGTNGNFLPDGLGSFDSWGGTVVLFRTNASGAYVLYTVQGDCHYAQYLAGPEFAGDVPTASDSCAVIVAAPEEAIPIPAWVQAYGRASADATCLDGWNQSWQSWAEPVTGGWVCTRDIPSLG